MRSETAILLHLKRMEIIIVGTEYAGEIKKSAFTVMNYLLPDEGALPMHSSVNVGRNQDPALFFGLSGTGKTTLSADPERSLISGMPTQVSQSPIGTDATSARRRRADRSAEYRVEEPRLAPFERVARMVIGRRIELAITQEELAERMGTSSSTISRIESGQHVTSVRTLERLADALEVKLLVGFETEAGDRELVAV